MGKHFTVVNISGAVASLELGERSEVLFLSPPLLSLSFLCPTSPPFLFYSPFPSPFSAVLLPFPSLKNRPL